MGDKMILESVGCEILFIILDNLYLILFMYKFFGFRGDGL